METFNEIINKSTPVLVDFFATWCGPCKALTPTIESIGVEMRGKVRVLKVDVDKNQSVALKYQIKSVPTLIVFKNGDIVWRQSGVMDKQTLINVLSSYI